MANFTLESVRPRLYEASNRATPFRWRRVLLALWAVSLGALSLSLQVAEIAVGPLIGALVVLAGLIAAAWICRIPMRARRRLRPLLEAALARRYGTEMETLTLVGVSPGPRRSTYEDDGAWDVGFIDADRDGLRFYGDFYPFFLPRASILDVRVSNGLNVRLIVRWADRQGLRRTLALEFLEARRRKGALKRAESLRLRLLFSDVRSELARPTGLPPIQAKDGTPLLLLEDQGWFLH